MKKRNVLTFIIGAVLVVIFLLLLFVFQVRQSETAVVATFGNPVATYTNAGAHVKWPWPIQKVYKYDQRVQNFEDKFSETYTKDSITLMASVYVGWRISDAGEFLRKFPGDPSVSVPNAQDQLENMVRSAKLAVIASNSFSALVNTDPQQLQFDEIENSIKQTVQTELSTNGWGVSIDFLGFKKIGLPENVTQAVFNRMKTEREEIIKSNNAAGASEAQFIRATAERQAAETISDAQAEAKKIQAQGEAAAASTYYIFQQNPELANYEARLEALQELLDKKSTLILDERTPPFDILSHLPTNSPAR